MIPGDFGTYDQAYVDYQAPRIRNFLEKWFRPQITGMENLPERPFLGVGNHSGGILIPDTLIWVSEYHTSGRKPPMVTLAHHAMFSLYPQRLARSLARLGAMRADARLALAALRSGHAVQVYPGGDNDACRSYWQRNKVVFAGRKGYVKLAQKAGVPIVPVVSIGAHETLFVLWDGVPLARLLGLDRRYRLTAFPLALCLPWGIWFGPQPGFIPLPSKVAIRVLPAIDPDGSVDEIDLRVRTAMQDALDEMARARRMCGAVEWLKRKI